jgi:hypothetical protein
MMWMVTRSTPGRVVPTASAKMRSPTTACHGMVERLVSGVAPRKKKTRNPASHWTD